MASMNKYLPDDVPSYQGESIISSSTTRTLRDDLNRDVRKRFWCHQCQAEIECSIARPRCGVCGDGFVELLHGQPRPQNEAGDSTMLGLVRLLGTSGPGSVVLSNGDGENRVIAFRRDNNHVIIRPASQQPQPNGSNNNNRPALSEADIQSTRGFAQLMAALITLSQAADADPDLDDLVARLMDADPNRWGPPPASKEAIDQLERLTITPDTCGDCTVCMDSLAVDEQAIKMPCGHTFHEPCLLSWLEKHNSCPMCRHELPTEDHDYERIRLRRQQQQQQQTQQQQQQSQPQSQRTQHDNNAHPQQAASQPRRPSVASPMLTASVSGGSGGAGAAQSIPAPTTLGSFADTRRRSHALSTSPQNFQHSPPTTSSSTGILSQFFSRRSRQSNPVS